MFNQAFCRYLSSRGESNPVLHPPTARWPDTDTDAHAHTHTHTPMQYNTAFFDCPHRVAYVCSRPVPALTICPAAHAQIQEKQKLAESLQKASALHNEQSGELRKEMLTLKQSLDKTKHTHRIESSNEKALFQRQQTALDAEIVKLQEAIIEQQHQENTDLAASPSSSDGSVAVSVSAVAADHPLLGALVADLGHKAVYLTPILALAQIPIWEKQRAFRRDRATGMARDIIRVANAHNAAPRPFAGSIVVYEHCAATARGEDATPELGILDGQHRVGALAILMGKGAWGETPPRVLVEVHRLDDMRDAPRLFRDINKAEPVREIDMVSCTALHCTALHCTAPCCWSLNKGACSGGGGWKGVPT